MKKLKKIIVMVINQIFIIILNRIFAICMPLKQNRVLFISNDREELGGNLKCMYDYIPNEKYEKIVSLKKDRTTKQKWKEKMQIVKYLSTSKYILLEDLVQETSYIKIRTGQELIQLWHASGAYKKFGHSRKNTDHKRLIHKGYKKYTKAITSSEKIKKCYAEAFSIDIDKIKATGVPRTDIFFDESYKKTKKQELYQKYPFLKGKKVILFAPTYRGTRYEDANYDITKLDLNKIYKELQEKYVFIFKWHPFIHNNEREEYGQYKKYPNFYYDLSQERDINDLLIITDILITDYSSVIFDYIVFNKPIIYFTYDLQEYINGRGLYFPFEEYIYGEIAQNDDEMIEAILKENKNEEKREKFIEKFVSACDGNSTKKTYNWIFKGKEK